MKRFEKIIPVLVILLNLVIYTDAQTAATSVTKEFIFSAIKGANSKADSILLPAVARSVKLTKGDTASFKIVSFKNGKLLLRFTPPSNFTGIARSKLQVNNSLGKRISEIELTGLCTKGLEGENEASLSDIIHALGYDVDPGWTSLANHCRPELEGDELPASLFQKAGNGKVEIIPVARYSPDFNLPFGYYFIKGSKPDTHQVAILAKAGAFPEHQTLFPALETGSSFFDPGKNSFGFYATSPTHSAYSEDVWNMLFFPANAVHATRIYPIKTRSGKPLINTYLLCFEEAKNGDYNDYVFLVKNIKPVTSAEDYTNLFNGKNLDGWDIFLTGKSMNNDSERNFVVQQDGSVYVKGKELGYIRTKKGLTNYHFVVEFKWGEKKWPPRENAKRDAGICYNIPDNEPDSIWPKSIECQIQEGDTGDFWLLGFSTITVNDSTNKPANHTRMVKKADAEKPTGEWNIVEVISYNGKCIHIVNGVVVNAGEKASVSKGRLLLQSEYSEVYYRHARIKQL